MKTMDEIRRLPRTVILAQSDDGFQAMTKLLSSPKNYPALVQGSWGCWWDHVSVSFEKRMPTWDEMAEIKRMYFRPDEVCYQLHPAEQEYVNLHKYCLHIWRPQREAVPVPPTWMVGPLKGQSMDEMMAIADKAYREWEEETLGQETSQHRR